MAKKQKMKIITSILLAFALASSSLIVSSTPAQAARKLGKPKFVALQCYYGKGSKVNLKWKKVKGATRYKVYRAAKKRGKYRKFAMTKKLRISKKASGKYFYKVRAFRGRKKSKMSKAMRIVAVGGRLTDMAVGSYDTAFRLLVDNKTKSPLFFYKYNYITHPSYDFTIYLVNIKKDEVVNRWNAYLYVPGGDGKKVQAKAQQSIYLYTYKTLPKLGSSGLRNDTYAYMVTASFKIGGVTFALAATNKANEAATAGR